MTVVHLPRPDRHLFLPELRRWAASLAAIALLHAAGLFVLLTWSPPVRLPPPPSEAIMIDLAPLPVPPPEQPPAVEPPPEPPPPPEEPPPPPVAEQPPEPPPPQPPPPEPVPPPKPEVVLPMKPPPVIHRPLHPHPPHPRPVPPAPVQMAPPPAPAAPAPLPAPPAAPLPAPRDPLADYAARLVAELARHQRYPVPSRQRHEEGVAQVQFTLDRSGHVSGMRIARSSGHPMLDEEAEAMIRRSEPLPPPPPEIRQNPLELVLPVRFSLR